MNDLKYFEILKELKRLREEQGEGMLKITILSNIIVNQLAEILEYSLRTIDITARIKVGNYDNIVQDAGMMPADEIVVIFWEAANLTDGLQYKIDHLPEKEYEAVRDKAENEIGMVFQLLGKNKLVLFNEFHPFPFSRHVADNSKLVQLTRELNGWLKNNHPENFQLIDTSKIIGIHGYDISFDIRNYFSSKALYTIEFFKSYANEIQPFFYAAAGKIKKVLVLDCDNTLWKGVVGEDGMDGIRMSPRDKEGLPFHAVQHKISALACNGVITCLCSKNNPADVDEVLSSHQDMVLKEDRIVIKKINWNDKASNLREIASELNVGLDSLVFIDDSDFEVNLIRSGLPEVTVFQVPKKLYRYPAMMDDVARLFYNPAVTREDKAKIDQYKAQIRRDSARKSFSDIEEYIRSLEISLKIHVNDEALGERMAQMTQKTNQFNLTTKRYTQQDISNMIASDDWDLFALGVSDRYGESGITGLAIIRHDGAASRIDTFLLSCRIIGRNIEYRFIDEIISRIDTSEIHAQYIRTLKNDQVSDFYEKAGFELLAEEDDSKRYRLIKEGFKPNEKYNYISILYGRET